MTVGRARTFLQFLKESARRTRASDDKTPMTKRYLFFGIDVAVTKWGGLGKRHGSV